MKDWFQLSPAFARFVFVHIKIILLSAFQQTLIIIHYQRPMSRLRLKRNYKSLYLYVDDVLSLVFAEQRTTGYRLWLSQSFAIWVFHDDTAC